MPFSQGVDNVDTGRIQRFDSLFLAPSKVFRLGLSIENMRFGLTYVINSVAATSADSRKGCFESDRRAGARGDGGSSEGVVRLWRERREPNGRQPPRSDQSRVDAFAMNLFKFLNVMIIS
jgi:hypothetical protein